ncbi:hypothetical protein EZS27_031137 [termite gut metagenome]|uniref:DUF3945 domain-containing protein n=1 Tax=termite gut metagenome TaxID=433724 RepID=A0A5J4QA68_9ZZZZ
MLKGVELSDKQQEGLKSGQGVPVENMDKKQRPGGKITRIVQYNAVNKNFDFLFTPEQHRHHQQEQTAKAEQKTGQDDNQPLKARKVGEVWVRPVQGGVELTREQFKDLCNNKPVWVEGMQRLQPKQQEGAKQTEATDQKGQKYNAWVWPDHEKGHIRHTSKHPDELKNTQGQKVQPAEGFKTQIAVNNEGKTNEATKQSTEPLKPGQTQPTQKQAEQKEQKRQEQRQSPAKPKKNTGHKL